MKQIYRPVYGAVSKGQTGVAILRKTDLPAGSKGAFEVVYLPDNPKIEGFAFLFRHIKHAARAYRAM